MKQTSLIALVVLTLVGCGSPREVPDALEHLQVVVGLDLSDRVRAEDQIVRDTTLTGAIIAHFESRGGSQDRLSIEVIPQHDAFDWYPVRDVLQIDVGAMDVRTRRNGLAEQFNAMRGGVRWLYEQALKQESFAGADTYSWLRDVYVSSTSGEQARTVIIVVSDGYTVASSNRSALGGETTFVSTAAMQQARSCETDDIDAISLRPPRTDLGQAEVLFAGVRPRVAHPCELEILRRVNSRWITSMGANRFAIEVSRSDLLASRRVINTFLDSRGAK